MRLGDSWMYKITGYNVESKDAVKAYFPTKICMLNFIKREVGKVVCTTFSKVNTRYGEIYEPTQLEYNSKGMIIKDHRYN